MSLLKPCACIGEHDWFCIDRPADLTLEGDTVVDCAGWMVMSKSTVGLVSMDEIRNAKPGTFHFVVLTRNTTIEPNGFRLLIHYGAPLA